MPDPEYVDDEQPIPDLTAGAIATRIVETLEGADHEHGLLNPKAMARVHELARGLATDVNTALLETSIRKVIARGQYKP